MININGIPVTCKYVEQIGWVSNANVNGFDPAIGGGTKEESLGQMAVYIEKHPVLCAGCRNKNLDKWDSGYIKEQATTNNPETTFENAKVGDRVWDIQRGWGKIKEIWKRETLGWKVRVLFEPNKEYPYEREHGYTHEGLGEVNGGNALNRTLFWDEVKIVAPEMPKRKVKKWQICYQVHLTSIEKTYLISSKHYKNLNEFIKEVGTKLPCELFKSSMIEVEEKA